jgi:N-acetylmuramoyl-L-alanine amidase
MVGDRAPAGLMAGLAIGLVVLAGPVAAEAGAQPDGEGVDLERHRGFLAAAVDELASAGFGRIQASDDGTVRLRLEGAGAVRLQAGSPFVRHGERTLQLANAPYRRDGRLWIPAELFVRILPSATAGAPTAVVREGRLVPRPAAGSSSSSSSAAAPADEVRVLEGAPSSGPFVVVIDPGHGGRDPGARGPRGTLEKRVTLGIARKLRDRLGEMDGVVPLMTRDRDTLIALRDRSRMAMRAMNRTYDGREPSGGLFVSLHANAVARGNARGFETYFLGRATSEQAREVAMRENSAIQYEEEGATPPPDDVRFILSDLDKTQWIIESNRVAGLTQNALRGRLSSPDRGVKQANYLVLVWASGSMPSVLVEAGFLSDRGEERMLASDSGQETVAAALAEAVRDYHRRYRQQLAGTAARE